jgi:hypothetical protein
MSVRKFVTLCVPPFVILGLKKIRSLFPSHKELFNGDGELFKKYVAKAKLYGEYGVGESTQYVFQNTTAVIRGVDTSQRWIQHVMQDKLGSARIDLQWVDVGPLDDWGRPSDYSKRANFSHYVESLWKGAEKPDVVLVDGRFRVSCFLYSLAQAAPETVIIFDDYTERPFYHVVEEFLSPTSVCGRQAIFCVPEGLDREKLLAESMRFNFVIY